MQRPKPVYKTHPPLPRLERWLDALPRDLQKSLADLAGTTENMFRQWITGRRKMSASCAGRLEDAMSKLKSDHPDIPEPMTRGDLCDVCKKCRYYEMHDI